MAYGFTPGDVAFLCSTEGEDALASAEQLPLTPSSLLSDVDALRTVTGARAGAVLETAVLRRRARSKVDDAQHWLLTDDALQQATPTPVAVHRAGRLAGRDVHDLTCSIGADLGAVAAVARRALGSDVDAVRLAMAVHNLPGVPLVRADALRPVSRGAVLLA
ncbi:MAG: class I SAM-dependent methyltransferase, partial [Pseudonocardiales bacterium]|nr:class I SAM-dependent methyltransferase [Pseudonocardiales bacterium]